MNALVTKATVAQEYLEASEYGALYGWQFSPINESGLLFTVLLVSPVDQERYELEFRFDDYPEKPYLIEFLHSPSGQRGTQACYPKGADHFFHPNAAICHPCSRKAYVGYAGLHGDWNMAGWQKIAGGMTNLRFILDGIYSRIIDKTLYHGRMAKPLGQ